MAVDAHTEPPDCPTPDSAPTQPAGAFPREPEWAWLQAFCAVLREGSLSSAARALGSTQPTMGRHIAALEAAWQVVLFTRSSTGLVPTDTAKDLASLAQGMRMQVDGMARAVESWRDASVQGTVRVSASKLIALEVLPALMRTLFEAHPRLRLEMAPDNALHDLVRREADLAVRMAAPTQAQLIARQIGSVKLGLFAHRNYLAREGHPRDLDALRQHRLIGFDRQPVAMPLPAAYRAVWQRAHFALRCDDDGTQWALVRAGAGIGTGLVALAARHPDLEAVLPGVVTLSLPLWLCMHEDLRHSRPHATVFRHLADGLLQHVAEAAPAP